MNKVDQELYDTLNDVRRTTQRGRRYKTDFEVWGQVEHWETPAEVAVNIDGDCDTDGLRVRSVLRALGIPNRLVVCAVNNPKGDHLVCEVEGWIFDVNYRTVKRREDLPYKFLAISGYDPGDPWHMISN